MGSQTLIAGLLTIAVCAGCSQAEEQASAAANPGSLAGIVTSEADGPMEGVLVSAKAIGRTITVTVVTDSQGRYGFPSGRLTPGRYQLGIRAAGYDLKDPGVVEMAADQTTEFDLRLQKTQNLPAQLMNAEWLTSFPGTPEQKRLATGCVSCHSLSLVARSGHDAKGWVSVLQRMGNHPNGSTLVKPFDEPGSPRYAKYWGAYADGEGSRTESGTDEEGTVVVSPRVAEQAAYLASVNLSSDPMSDWKYELRTLPRPTGKETRVIMTEYDLPRPDTQPHDAVVDADGMVWYHDFSDSFIGRLNPRTGEVREWPMPAIRPFPPFHGGGLDVKLDSEGNPWFALMRQAAVAKFDKKTEKITTWSLPPRHNTLDATVIMVAPSPTGLVWFASLLQGDSRTSGRSAPYAVHGLDPKTGHITSYDVPVFVYGLEATPDGDVVFFSLSGGVVGELDAKTGKITLHTPPTPASGPRRGDIDAQGRAWFAQYRAGQIGMFDPRSKAIQEWPISVPWADPYDVVVHENGDVWAGGMLTDYVFRLNPATGDVTKYLLPTVNTNIRRIDVDGSAKPTVWIGENHHGKIMRVEPLD